MFVKYHTDGKCQSHLMIDEFQSNLSTTVIAIYLMVDECQSDPMDVSLTQVQQ